ncbi:SLCO3A [Mytilus coruscus]|uniref:SLCO3A n=1 Tax=Mytilus coruscus TaxID=42192 RepID=A0A6J8D0W5_MYTCO|nr:SLCO3A [Mytilus coruscus]
MRSEIQCGIGRFKPDCLQCCATMKIFTVFYSISALMTSTISVYIASQITTIEKQFGFTSSQSGLLMSCNDIGYLAVTLFISFFAEKLHAPRVLSFSTLLFGAAGIICAIPYFISPMYSKSFLTKTSNVSRNGDFLSKMMSSGQLCEASSTFAQSNSNMSCSSKSDTHTSVGVANDFTSVAMAIIAIGMILQGIGKSPRQAFITTYIDNNVKKTQTAIYVEFFKSIYGLFRNKLYVLIIVGRCLILILVSGSVAFGPKYIETQFTLPAWKSSLVIDLRTVSCIGPTATAKPGLCSNDCPILILRCIVLIIDIVAYLIARKKTDWNTGETRRERKNDLPEKQSFIVDERDTNGNNSYIKTFLENKEFKETEILS